MNLFLYEQLKNDRIKTVKQKFNGNNFIYKATHFTNAILMLDTYLTRYQH